MAKLTEKEIKEKVEENGFIFIAMERIKDNKGRRQINVTIKCKNGHLTTKRWSNIRDGKGCQECVGNRKFTLKEVREYVESFKYQFLSNEYKGKDVSYEFMCDKGHKYSTTYNVFRRGFRCPYCSNKHKYSYEEVKFIIEKENYKLLSKEYHNALEYIEVQCDKGHDSYKVKFSDFNNNNRRCPYCNESKGEKRISIFLNNTNIKYETQYKFEDCKSIKCLPFDFYLTDMNILIEFDGEGHYRPINWKGNKDIAFDTFVGTIIRDTIKNEYCKKNGIKLIRIPYWEYDNIEEILKCELKLDKHE